MTEFRVSSEEIREAELFMISIKNVRYLLNSLISFQFAVLFILSCFFKLKMNVYDTKAGWFWKNVLTNFCRVISEK